MGSVDLIAVEIGQNGFTFVVLGLLAVAISTGVGVWYSAHLQQRSVRRQQKADREAQGFQNAIMEPVSGGRTVIGQPPDFDDLGPGQTHYIPTEFDQALARFDGQAAAVETIPIDRQFLPGGVDESALPVAPTREPFPLPEHRNLDPLLEALAHGPKPLAVLAPELGLSRSSSSPISSTT